MTKLNDFYKKIKRQYINCFVIRAASLKDYIIHSLPFLASYHSKNGRSAFPLNITIDLSHSCNLNCGFCFLYDQSHPDDFNPNDPFLTYKEIEKIVVSLRGKPTSFFLTGGEPTLRKDFSDIVRLIKANRFRCGVVTNGTILTKAISDNLIKNGADYLFFSLDGPEDIHNNLRGNGTFQKTYNNIEYLSRNRTPARKPRIIMGTMVLPENCERLKEIVDIGCSLKVDLIALDFPAFLNRDEFTAHQRSFTKYFPDDQFRSSVYVHEFPACQMEKLPGRINDVRQYANKKGLQMFLKPDLRNEEMAGWFNNGFRFNRTCIYPWNVMRISPKGDVYPCAQFYIPMGNVRLTSIEDIWNNDKFRYFRNLLKKNKMFAGCNRCCKL